MCPDVPQYITGGLDRPGCPLPGEPYVPEALPPATFSSGDVWSCTQSLGLPAQCLCQEKSLPLQVSWSIEQNVTSQTISLISELNVTVDSPHASI